MITKLDMYEKANGKNNKTHLTVPQNVCHNIESFFVVVYLAFSFIR
jgi:hypothetical protein